TRRVSIADPHLRHDRTVLRIALIAESFENERIHQVVRQFETRRVAAGRITHSHETSPPLIGHCFTVEILPRARPTTSALQIAHRKMVALRELGRGGPAPSQRAALVGCGSHISRFVRHNAYHETIFQRPAEETLVLADLTARSKALGATLTA